MNLEENLGDFFTPGDPGVVTATIGTTPVVGEFQYASAEDLDIAGRVASFTCATADLPIGPLFGVSVSIGTAVLRITSSNPDGTGISILALELVSGTPPDQDATWENLGEFFTPGDPGVVTATIGTTPVVGEFRYASAEDPDIAGRVASFACATADLPSGSLFGVTVSIGTAVLRITSSRPDGIGISILGLELVSGTPPDQDVTWEDLDVLLSEEIGGTECEILGVTMQGLLDAPPSDDLEMVGSSPVLTVLSTPAVDAAPSGTPVRVGMRRYRAKTVLPDGTGFTHIPLEEGVTFGCNWYRAAVPVDVGIVLEAYLRMGTLPAGTLLLLPDMAEINPLLSSGALTLALSESIAAVFYYRVLGAVEYGTGFDTTYVRWFSLPVNRVIGIPDARWVESLVSGGDLEPLYQEG